MSVVLPKEALYSQRATGVAVFRAGIVSLICWALASAYLFLTLPSGPALFGAVLFLAVPLLAFVLGLGIYAVAVNSLRQHYGEGSVGLLRRQSRNAATASGEESNDMDAILRRMENDFK